MPKRSFFSATKRSYMISQIKQEGVRDFSDALDFWLSCIVSLGYEPLVTLMRATA